MSWSVTVDIINVVITEFFLQFCNVFSAWAFLIVGLILIELAVLISPLLAASLFYCEVCFFVEDRSAGHHCDRRFFAGIFLLCRVARFD